jgi:hypothetical protein
MTVIIINKEEYISSDVLFEKAPVYCKLSRSGRDLIRKKKITDYIFAKLVNKEWCVSNGKSYKYDKIFIKKSFYDTIPEVKQDKVIVDENNIQLAPDIIYLDDSEKFKDENGVCVEIETRGTRKAAEIYFKVKDVSISFKMNNLVTTIIDKRKGGYIENQDYKYFNCEKKCNEKTKTKIKKELFLTFYGLLRLFINSPDPKTKECNVVNIIKNNYNDINWICDKPLKCKYRPDMYSIINDNVLIIEIDEHQHKHYDDNIDKIRTKSICNEFKNKNVTIIRFNPDIYKDSENISHNTITDNDNEMSIRMSILIETINETINNTHSGIKEIKLFFDNFKLNINNISTYHYNKNIKDKKFPSDMLKNVYNIVFTSLLGTSEQKQTLSASLLGLNTQTIKDVFNSGSNKTPTVYLFNIGSANQLLKTDIYKDDDILCKYGCTDDISRRTSEHERNFKKQYNVDITLLLYSIIDPQYIFDAETNIRQYFKSNKISSDDKSELIVINNKNITQIKQHYKMIQNSYIGRYEEINNKIIQLEKYILELKHQLELKDKDLELKQKDILLANQKNELLEMKLLMLKTQKSGLLIKKS